MPGVAQNPSAEENHACEREYTYALSMWTVEKRHRPLAILDVVSRLAPGFDLLWPEVMRSAGSILAIIFALKLLRAH
jgi:hypothetical protein